MSPTSLFHIIPSARRSSLGRASAGRDVHGPIDLLPCTSARPVLSFSRGSGLAEFADRLPQGSAGFIVRETLAHIATLARRPFARHHVNAEAFT